MGETDDSILPSSSPSLRVSPAMMSTRRSRIWLIPPEISKSSHTKTSGEQMDMFVGLPLPCRVERSRFSHSVAMIHCSKVGSNRNFCIRSGHPVLSGRTGEETF